MPNFKPSQGAGSRAGCVAWGTTGDAQFDPLSEAGDDAYLPFPSASTTHITHTQPDSLLFLTSYILRQDFLSIIFLSVLESHIVPFLI